MEISGGKKCIDREMEKFCPIVDGWIKATTEYSNRHEGDDAGYWYIERSNVSLLSAGVWLQGGVALEEYSCSKKGYGEGSRSGRADLYIDIGEIQVSIEAKQSWVHFNKSDEFVKGNISKYLQRAINDVKQVKEDTNKIGVCFFIPRFSSMPIYNYKEDHNSLISKLIDQYVSTKRTADLWAWCFPKSSRLLIHEGQRFYYPGVMVGFKKWKLI